MPEPDPRAGWARRFLDDWCEQATRQRLKICNVEYEDRGGKWQTIAPCHGPGKMPEPKLAHGFSEREVQRKNPPISQGVLKAYELSENAAMVAEKGLEPLTLRI